MCAAVTSGGPSPLRGDLECTNLPVHRQQQCSGAAAHPGSPQDGPLGPKGQDCGLQYPGAVAADALLAVAVATTIVLLLLLRFGCCC